MSWLDQSRSELTSLEQKVEQYYNLKQAKKLTDERLAKLKQEIEHALVMETTIVDNKVSGRVSNYDVTLQFRSSKPAPDEGALEQLLIDKGLWGQATHISVDHDAVEQLYLNGKITDRDLRNIGAESKITVALHVEKVTDNV